MPDVGGAAPGEHADPCRRLTGAGAHEFPEGSDPGDVAATIRECVVGFDRCCTSQFSLQASAQKLTHSAPTAMSRAAVTRVNGA